MWPARNCATWSLRSAEVPGYNVTLTIDTRLQQAAEAALQGEIDFWNR